MDAKRTLQEYLYGKDGKYDNDDDDDDRDGDDDDNGSTKQHGRNTNVVQEASFSWNLFSDATTTVSVAASNVLDSMLSLGKTLDDTVVQAVEQSRDAIQDATQFMRQEDL